MITSRYVVRDCDGFDEHGDAYVLVPTCEDYYEQLVDLEPCFFGPCLPPYLGCDLPPDWLDRYSTDYGSGELVLTIHPRVTV